MESKADILHFREARINDITGIMTVRFSVKENVLSDPSLVTPKDNEEYLTVRGKGWVCETGGSIVGFSIVDMQDKSIWALFVQPEYEGKGIGKKLQDLMLDWYFSETKEKVRLGTAADTRAEKFYNLSGWKEIERKERMNAASFPWTEIIFEMNYDDWQKT